MAPRRVILIPGFTGSQLSITGGFFKGDDVWFNPVWLIPRGPGDLQLDAAGSGPGPLAKFGPLAATRLVPFGPYQGIINALQPPNWIVEAWLFDWRKRLTENAAELADHLVVDLAGVDFWVVAHSQGGLLARAAANDFFLRTGGARWKRTVYLGCPHGGSYEACKALAGRQDYLGLMTMLFRVSDLFGVASGSSAQLNQTVGSWPGLYELLPDRDAPFNLDPNADGAYLLPNYNNTGGTVTQPNLDNAVAYWHRLTAFLSQGKPPEVCVVGRGQPTAYRLAQEAGDLSLGTAYRVTNEGDGVVSVERATLPQVKTLSVESTHYQLPAHGDVLRELPGMLLNGLPDDELFVGFLPDLPPKRVEIIGGAVPAARQGQQVGLGNSVGFAQDRTPILGGAQRGLDP